MSKTYRKIKRFRSSRHIVQPRYLSMIADSYGEIEEEIPYLQQYKHTFYRKEKHSRIKSYRKLKEDKIYWNIVHRTYSYLRKLNRRWKYSSTRTPNNIYINLTNEIHNYYECGYTKFITYEYTIDLVFQGTKLLMYYLHTPTGIKVEFQSITCLFWYMYKEGIIPNYCVIPYPKTVKYSVTILGCTEVYTITHINKFLNDLKTKWGIEEWLDENSLERDIHNNLPYIQSYFHILLEGKRVTKCITLEKL